MYCMLHFRLSLWTVKIRVNLIKIPSIPKIWQQRRNGIVGGKLVRAAIPCRACFWPATRERLPTLALCPPLCRKYDAIPFFYDATSACNVMLSVVRIICILQGGQLVFDWERLENVLITRDRPVGNKGTSTKYRKMQLLQFHLLSKILIEKCSF